MHYRGRVSVKAGVVFWVDKEFGFYSVDEDRACEGVLNRTVT